jgi:FAD:protein FMN transferase
VAVASEGAFDPTVEPLVRATGGLGGPRRSLAEGERKALLARIGASGVHVDVATRAIRLEPGTALDLGGIAKGYAADLALEALRAAGASTGLVDLGASSIGVFGTPLTVDVRDPEKADAPPWASFVVENASVSTSGGDQRPGHIFDPRTGLPATGILSATVVAATGIEADALSTAVYVLGADAGLTLLLRRGADGLALERRGRRAIVRATPGFQGKYGLRLRSGVTVR